ncbi:MAG: DNA internalization-related competence protein ComEC/Rec2 [Betaproteobacteria bacterium]|nr:DNA internalization-related competence protein ComEC/Rec2 [Betaproteobacteria bacterium]
MTSLYLLALVAGAWLLQQQAVLPDLTGATALVPLAVLWIVLARQSGAAIRALSRAVAIVAFAAAGFFWAAAVGHWKLADDLPEIWEGRDVEISGVVAEMVQPNDRGVRFLFDVERAYTLNARIPSRISLMWYANDGESPPDLHAGQRWRLMVRLHRPHGNANPDGFDFEAWMLERGIRAVGYIRGQPAPHLIGSLVWRPGYLLERSREAARKHLLDALGDRPYAGVIVALAIGDQQAIPPDQWRVFTRTGVNHLMSISGLHITMVASLVLLLVLRMWRRSETLVLNLPAIRAATVCGLVVALAYAALSGFAVPAQRTVYMLAVVAVALWSGWAARPAAVLAAAAALVVVLDPMAVISPGFWLSFGAVAVIVLAGGSRIGSPGWFRAWAQTQWAVTLAFVPFLLTMFQQVSLVSPLANAFAIPLVSLIVVPLALAASVLPLDWIAHAAHLIMAFCMLLLQALSDLPDAVWQQHAPPAWAVPIGIAGALWMLLPKGFPARWVGAAMILPLFLWLPAKLAPGELRVTVLDVGQGLAVVVRTREHALLYDTGPAFTEQIDAGGRIVVPYLRAAGVGRLDGMIVSHDDSDHSGGALSVLQAMPVAWLASSLPQDHAIRMAATSSRLCGTGEGWQWDGVSFEFLHPQPADYNDSGAKDNDRSCVLRVVSPYGSILLPGDIEKRSEFRMLQFSGNLRADVLIAPHHGSRTSSTPEFVQAVAPSLTVFSVGYRNRFGHPHPAVNARYRQAGSRTLRTDFSGALLIGMNPAGIEVQGWREVNRKYWAGR